MNYHISIAYLLWFLSFFGLAGLHRFYLRRYGTGVIWLFTWGLFLVGTIYDFFALPRMVRESNLGRRYREALFGEIDPLPLSARAKETPERVILRTARRNQGQVTPGEVALEGDIPIEEAKAHLDRLVSKGYAEMQVRSSGAIVYVFADFRPHDGQPTGV